MKKRQDSRKKTMQALTMISQFGLIMIVSMGMTTALGIWLDKKLGTSFLAVLFFFVGAAAGGQSIYRMAKQLDGEEDRKK